MLKGDAGHDNRWESIVSDFLASGEPIGEWAKSHGVNEEILQMQIPQNAKDQKTSSKRRKYPEKRTSADWRIIQNEQIASGMPRSIWCKENGINEDAMNSAMSRLREKDKAVKKVNNIKKNKPVFVRALPDEGTVKAEELFQSANSAKITIQYREVTIEADSGYPAEILIRIVKDIVS